MKLLKFLNPRKNKSSNSPSRSVRSGYVRSNSFSTQTRESQLLLKRIKDRKRGLKSSRVIFRKHHGLAKKILVLILFIGVLSYLVYRFNILDYFKVSLVQVEGATDFVNAEDVKTLVERNSVGQSIFLLKTENVAEILRKSFLGAKKVEVEKDYPNKILITIEERIPLAVVYNNEGEYFLIDSEGYVLGVIDESFSDLPKIKYEGYILVGTFLKKEMIPVSIEILQFAEKEELKISSMSFYPNHAKIFIGGNTEIFIGYDKDREKDLKTVNALIKKSAVEGKEIKKIDLRYDKVIVLYD